MSGRLREHELILRGERVVLRPMTEKDWRLVQRWWNDPDISYYTDANVADYSLPELQEIMRAISRKASCFVIEHRGEAVGDCWLQEMNLDRILERYADRDCQRIDIGIVKKLWSQGFGSEELRLLVDFGFSRDGAETIFGCDIDGRHSSQPQGVSEGRLRAPQDPPTWVSRA